MMQTNEEHDNTKHSSNYSKVMHLNSPSARHSFLQRQRVKALERQRNNLKRSQLVMKTAYPRIGYHQYVKSVDQQKIIKNEKDNEREQDVGRRNSDNIHGSASKTYDRNFELDELHLSLPKQTNNKKKSNLTKTQDLKEKKMSSGIKAYAVNKKDSMMKEREALSKDSEPYGTPEKNIISSTAENLPSSKDEKIYRHLSLSPKKEICTQKHRMRLHRSMSSLSDMMNNATNVEPRQVSETIKCNIQENIVTSPQFSLQDLDIDNPDKMKKFLMSPFPKEAGTLQCYIKRNRKKNKLYPEYNVYLKQGDLFLMSSRKRPNNKTSNYLISMVQNDYDRSSPNILGKLRANFMGTEFQLFDEGQNPKDALDDPFSTDISKKWRSELGVILYARNVLGSNGPRKIQVGIQTSQCSKRETNSIVKSDEEMLTCLKNKMKPFVQDMMIYQNKTPQWSHELGAYVLNFNGRVTMPSVKNFQLAETSNGNGFVLQFGRTEKEEFIMDLQWPMTPFQAFGITLSSFDSKIACD